MSALLSVQLLAFYRSLTMPQRFIAHICFLSLVLSAAVTVQAQQPKADSDATISQTLQAMEQAWLNAEKNHDTAAFEKIVADDWLAITPDGKSQTKAERAAAIKAAHTTSVTMGDMKVRVFGDTAVVTGTDDEITTEEGKKSSGHYIWTDVFAKRNGKWLAVASQTAQIK
jgi:ketosteroid isomerase-like protein